MWNGKTLAVVLPTYNEADSIAECIRGFEALGIVDDIVVVNNNAHPGHVAGGRRHQRPRGARSGPGLRRGDPPRAARDRDADLVCICEPDGTFDPDDLFKLLPFTVDVDVVFGSRTVQTFILQRRQHGLVPALGQLGRRQAHRGALQHRATCPTSAARSACSRATRSTSIEPEFAYRRSSFGFEMMLHRR